MLHVWLPIIVHIVSGCFYHRLRFNAQLWRHKERIEKAPAPYTQQVEQVKPNLFRCKYGEQFPLDQVVNHHMAAEVDDSRQTLVDRQSFIKFAKHVDKVVTEFVQTVKASL